MTAARPARPRRSCIRLIEAGLSVDRGVAGGDARWRAPRSGETTSAALESVHGRTQSSSTAGPDEDPAVLTRPEAIRLVVGRGRVFAN